jgi:prevent-host-death family protein
MNELPVAVTIAELRADMRNITHRLLEGDSFTLTSYGDPIAVLVPVAEYTNLTTQES